MLSPKKFEIRRKNVKTVKELIKVIQSVEIEPDPSKDRAMLEGDNP
jgi:hypothetical protein